MAHTGDMELDLDQNGDLQGLKKKGKDEYLSPEQMATCVKFVRLESYTNKDGEDDLIRKPYVGDVKGMKVNVIGGATGSGKTSLITTLAGGMREMAASSSVTKCPTVYILTFNELDYALMDTAGLCDTAAESFNDLELKELLINAVAAAMKLHNLVMVTFTMLVDKQSRLPSKFGENWPTFQRALGGDAIHVVAQFVYSKANMESKTDQVMLARELKDTSPQSLYQQLKMSPLKWSVVTAGDGNLEDFQAALQPISSVKKGVGASVMDAGVECLERKKEMANEFSSTLQVLHEQLQEGLDSAQFDAALDTLQKQIDKAREDLHSLGGCDHDKKRKINDEIKEHDSELLEMRQKRGNTEAERKKVQEQAFALTKKLQDKMHSIRVDEDLGSFFTHLVGGVKKVFSIG